MLKSRNAVLQYRIDRKHREARGEEKKIINSVVYIAITINTVIRTNVAPGSAPGNSTTIN